MLPLEHVGLGRPKYTHIDLELARKLNYTIDLIMDNKPNAMIYTNEKLVHGKDLFGDGGRRRDVGAKKLF